VKPLYALVCAVGLVVLAGLGAVVLIDAGHADDAQRLLSWATPIIAALFLAARINVAFGEQSQRLDSHDEKLTKITEQTNGVLDKRIADGVTHGVTKVLVSHGLIPGNPYRPHHPPRRPPRRRRHSDR
jgi:hypothetical protein